MSKASLRLSLRGLVSVGFGFAPLSAYAQSVDGAAVVSPVAVYVVTIIVGVLTAFVLNRVARASAKVDLPTTSLGARDAGLEKTIEQRLAYVLPAKENRAQVMRAISGVVEERMTTKVQEVTTQLKSKYETAIAEKDKAQEVISVKYKNLVKEKNQTEAIVQSIAEGLVVVNGKGEVVMMNPAAEKILGVEKKQKMGRPLTENLSGNELVSLVNDVKGSGEKVVEVNATQQETKKIIRASSALIENENGQTVGMVSVLTDVTKQRELDRIKSQFVSTVTHELRTPLVATQKALDVVGMKAAGPLNDDQARFIDIARRNLDRLNRLINDILDFSKLEAGKMKLELAETSIERAIDDVHHALGTWAQSKEISLEKRIGPDIPPLMMDVNRIIQVLNNLVSNGLKFTPKGGRVIMEAKVRNNGQEVEVSVEDSGVGIPKKDLDRVFERFLQLSERRQTDISGTGLGLSIAQEIVELHGGKIWAESEEGHGAKFIFVLPVKRATA